MSAWFPHHPVGSPPREGAEKRSGGGGVKGNDPQRSAGTSHPCLSTWVHRQFPTFPLFSLRRRGAGAGGFPSPHWPATHTPRQQTSSPARGSTGPAPAAPYGYPRLPFRPSPARPRPCPLPPHHECTSRLSNWLPRPRPELLLLTLPRLLPPPPAPWPRGGGAGGRLPAPSASRSGLPTRGWEGSWPALRPEEPPSPHPYSLTSPPHIPHSPNHWPCNWMPKSPEWRGEPSLEPPKPPSARAPASVSPAPPHPPLSALGRGDLKLAPTSGTPLPTSENKTQGPTSASFALAPSTLPSLRGGVSAGEEAGSGLRGRLWGGRELAPAPCPLRGGTGGMGELSPFPPRTKGPSQPGRRSLRVVERGAGVGRGGEGTLGSPLACSRAPPSKAPAPVSAAMLPLIACTAPRPASMHEHATTRAKVGRFFLSGASSVDSGAGRRVAARTEPARAASTVQIQHLKPTRTRAAPPRGWDTDTHPRAHGRGWGRPAVTRRCARDPVPFSVPVC